MECTLVLCFDLFVGFLGGGRVLSVSFRDAGSVQIFLEKSTKIYGTASDPSLHVSVDSRSIAFSAERLTLLLMHTTAAPC